MKKRIWIELFAIMVLLLILTIACKKKNDDEGYPPAVAGLFDNSFDSATTYPAPSKVTFTRKNNGVVADSVFPGQVIVLASDASATEIAQLITQNNGTILAQVPNAGLYLASINAVNLNAFLSAMYQSSLVTDAFPNQVISGKGFLNQCGVVSVTGDPNSIVQSIDLSADMGCSDHVYHKDAVGAVAGVGGVGVNVNDVTVYDPGTSSAGTDSYKSMQKMLALLNYAYQHNQPVIINMSMGGDDNIQDDDYFYYKHFAYLLQAVEKQNPHLLDNAVILLSGADVKRNETNDFNKLHTDFPGSPIWDHLYFVDSQEGASGCNLGYSDIGTANVLSAPACNVQIPNSVCTQSGNSFSTPRIARLVAQTHGLLEQANIHKSIPEITSKLWTYQKEHNGSLPNAVQLYSICAGDGGFNNKYDGTWNGTFFYTAVVPQTSGPPTTVHASFSLTITLVSSVSVPGQPQMLTVTSVTSSDPTFGATSPVVPTPPLNMALLPATFGSNSLQGMGIIIDFPNGSHINTSNLVDGSFTVDTYGRILASTNLVSTAAFSAGGQVDDSNLPGSGPGGYAYNWCTFTSWAFVR